VNPGTMLDVVDGLQVFLESEGIEDVNDLIGVAARRAETNFEA